MLEFRRITSRESEYFSHFQELYISAFPADERRPTDKLIEKIEIEKQFYCNIILEDGSMVGLLTMWDFGRFIYIEHFAVDEQVRDRGIGAEAMTQFVKYVGKSIILEVELPDNELSIRRIGFYQRLGYKLCDKAYAQPPYDPSLNSIPLALMEYGDSILESDFDVVVRDIHKKVYGV